MRDKRDNATLDLPGFAPAAPREAATQERRAINARPRKAGPRQEQLELLEETDATGLPVWRHDDNTDLTGLPVWAAA